MMSEILLNKSPFKFLNPYDKEDKQIFFGRDPEIQELYKMVFRSDIILIYGQSGTGKTSLVQCGLASQFDSTEWKDLYIRRGESISESLFNELEKQAITPLTDFNEDGEISITEAVESLYLDFFQPIYLVFDQFEELFISGSKEEQAIFIQNIKEIQAARVNCKMLFVMREEYIAFLYDFEKEIPELLEKRLRVEQMSLRSLSQVIQESAKKFEIEIENQETTTEQIIRNIGSGKTGGVQLPYLQVYLDKLFQVAKSEYGYPIRFDNYLVDKVGPIEDVLSNFVDTQIKLFDNSFKAAGLGIAILSNFITHEGTKKPVPFSKLVEILEPKDHQQIQDYLKYLEEVRLIRGNEDNIFELSHDSIAQIINENLSIEQRSIRDATKLVKDGFRSYPSTKEYLTSKQLNFIDPYIEKINLEPEEENFFIKSKKVNSQARLKLFGAIGLVLMIIGVAAFAIWNWDAVGKERDRIADSRDSLSIEKDKLEEDQLALKQDSTRLEKDKADLEKQKKSAIERGDSLDIKRILALELLNDAKTKGLEAELKRLDAKSKMDKALEASAIAEEKANLARLAQAKADSLTKEANKIKESYRLLVQALQTTIPNETGLDGEILGSGMGFSLAVNASKLDENNQNELIKVILQYLYNYSTLDKFVGQVKHPLKSLLPFTVDRNTFVTNIEGNKLNYIDLFGNTGSFETEDPADILYASTASFDGALYTFHRNGKLYSNKVSAEGIFKQEFLSEESPEINSTLLDPNGNIIILEYENEGIKIIDKKGNKIDLPRRDGKLISCGLFDAGDKMVTSYEDGSLYLSNANGTTIKELKGHQRNVPSIGISPNNEYFVTGDKKGDVIIWDGEAGARLFNIRAHSNAITSIAISHDGSMFATSSKDTSVKIWDWYGRLIREIGRGQGLSADIKDIQFTKDKTALLVGDKNNNVRLFDIQNSEIRSFKGHPYEVYAVAFSPNGRWVLSGTNSTGIIDHSLRLWDLSTGSFEKLNIEIAKVKNVVFSPKSEHFLITDTDDEATLFDLSKKKFGRYVQKKLKHGSREVTAIAFSSDGKRIATGGRDKYIHLWDIKGKLIHTLPEQKSAIQALQFSYDGKYLLSSSKEENLKIWVSNGDNFKEDNSLPNTREVSSISVHPNNDYILVVSNLKAVLIPWQAEVPEQINAKIRTTFARAATLSQNGEQILLGSKNGKGYLYSTQGKLLQVFEGHQDDITSVSLSSDGNYALTGSQDKTIKVWSIKMPLDKFLEIGPLRNLSDSLKIQFGINE